MSPHLVRYAQIHLQEPTYRACFVCMHGGSQSASTRCSHQQAGQTHNGTVQAMRAHGGPCGPEAHLMDFPGLQVVR